MIRFVDMRAADAPGHRFAFWDTVRDRFVCIVGYAWETWSDFEEERESVGSLLGDAYPLERFKGLCPAWVFEPPPAEGVCFRCLNAGHEPEECPRDAATVVFAVARALRESAAWREKTGDIVEPRALRNFADSIDPTSEEYDANHDPLTSIRPPIGPFTHEAPIVAAERLRKHDIALDVLARVDELKPALIAAFEGRPLMLGRDDVASSPKAVSHQELERWYLDHGVRCRVTTRRGGPFGYQCVFLEAELVP